MQNTMANLLLPAAHYQPVLSPMMKKQETKHRVRGCVPESGVSENNGLCLKPMYSNLAQQWTTPCKCKAQLPSMSIYMQQQQHAPRHNEEAQAKPFPAPQDMAIP
jgi:hypothetical protein